jgi:DNA-binding MarR family transcriptional regulator
MMTDQEVFLGIVRIGETLTQHLTAILEPFRLTLSQYSVLNSLRLAGDTGLACGEIAERLTTRDPDITRLVDRLEVRGFVRRLRERPDRRVVRAQLTADGLLLLEQLDAPIGQLHARHIAPIGKRQLGALSALLEVAYAAPPSPARLASR